MTGSYSIKLVGSKKNLGHFQLTVTSSSLCCWCYFTSTALKMKTIIFILFGLVCLSLAFPMQEGRFEPCLCPVIFFNIVQSPPHFLAKCPGNSTILCFMNLSEQRYVVSTGVFSGTSRIRITNEHFSKFSISTYPKFLSNISGFFKTSCCLHSLPTTKL